MVEWREYLAFRVAIDLTPVLGLLRSKPQYLLKWVSNRAMVMIEWNYICKLPRSLLTQRKCSVNVSSHSPQPLSSSIRQVGVCHSAQQ